MKRLGHRRFDVETLEGGQVPFLDGTKANRAGRHRAKLGSPPCCCTGSITSQPSPATAGGSTRSDRDVFEANVVSDVDATGGEEGLRLSFIDIGDGTVLNVFEIEGNTEADRQVPMFGRGRIDHIGLRAKDFDAFEEIRRRLMARGAADDFVTDFGSDLSLFFRDPDGLEGEVLVDNPDALPGQQNPPGTRAARFPAQV